VFEVDCTTDPAEGIKEMFVDTVQRVRIEQGERPALRAVFQKQHGAARGVLRVRADLPDTLRVGLFTLPEVHAWVRFSSDTTPDQPDFKSTLGVGLKLFGVPGPMLIGCPSDTNMDLIFQNHDVFFVATAQDMCEFTRAGIVGRNNDAYLQSHPKTADILNNMAKPVASVLGSAYWGILPFRLGDGRIVKYKLSPDKEDPPLSNDAQDRDYLGNDLVTRLGMGDTGFTLFVQVQTDPARMPIDDASARWDEALSPPIAVADLMLPRQNVDTPDQVRFAENLSFNIWRVPAEHAPLGSIAASRRIVYAASADQRRQVNGVSLSEPLSPNPTPQTDPAPAPADQSIVRARIHPGIGIARVGDSSGEYVIGPEVIAPQYVEMRDATGALKRQAARFRLYGLNQSGQVVRELTADDAQISWTVHVANRKAAWYRFIAALDLPEAINTQAPLRNAMITGQARAGLVIDPGPVSIQGPSQANDPRYRLDGGMFRTTPVSLGELRTDEMGRLLVLGGHGRSGSPGQGPIYSPDDGDTFNNADDWFDDTCDGPVSADVVINGQPIPVDDAWVVVGPPNYAPDVIGWRTMADLLVDLYVRVGWLPLPTKIRFFADVLPILCRLSDLQWVNAGFAAMFGRGRPMDFDNPDFCGRLAQPPDPDGFDLYHELRQQLFNAFRGPTCTVDDRSLWPWLYGDAFGSYDPASPRNGLILTELQAWILGEWSAGRFERGNPLAPLSTIEEAPLAQQPDVLDRAALTYCLADAFHPGCELTWPMRHISLYQAPFRIRHRPPDEPEPDLGAQLNRVSALAVTGPLHAQPPGGLTRWMALPWQGDTACCRSGYDPQYDPYLPTFWPTRAPNHVLTEANYRLVIDTGQPRATRLAAYYSRENWLRTIDGKDPAAVMQRMVDQFGAMGIVEARLGVTGDPELPEVMLVENVPARVVQNLIAAGMHLGPRPPSPDPLLRAGWIDQEHLAAFRTARIRVR
jgi:L-Lysine epsilon oxidase N-terminal/L-lysine epsilon oxidase C-terminal domain